MKQYMTKKQLNELSPVAKRKLREWWIDNHRGLNMGTVTSANNCYQFYEGDVIRFMWSDDMTEIYPLLSIGQMIMFIDEYDKGRYLVKLNGGWITEEDGINPIPELRDALFKVVKGILEQETQL